MSTASAPSAAPALPHSAPSFDPGRIVSAIWAPSTWLAFVHLLVNLPLGILWFTLLAIGVSLGLGLLITLLGIPVLIATGWFVRSAGHLERTRINSFLGTALQNPYRPAPEASGWLARLFAIGKDPATWRDFLFLMLRLPMGLFSFTALITSWSLGLGLLLSPVAYLFGVFRIDLGPWIITGPGAVFTATLCGLGITILAAWLTRGLGRLEAVLAGALLDASPEELQRRVTALAASRARTMSASDQDRRRLERDLHDGAQQRLVSLAMTLGLAQHKLETNPEQGARLVAEAHEEAKRALQDLRDLARGIHPAVLTDHGLEAALPALAARCPIPTRVDVSVSPRPEPSLEAAAYFVVSEALTNVTKHSQASEVRITARRDDHHLSIEIHDDGVGGASIGDHGGLSGLRDRVEALDGRLSLDSPTGGPTRLRVELPCGS